MFKDKSKLLLLGALVLLFVVLTNGVFNIHLGLFRGGPLGTIMLIALATWCFTRSGGCFKGCCRPQERKAEEPAKQAEDQA